jgi:type I restriction enzyme, S subunit
MKGVNQRPQQPVETPWINAIPTDWTLKPVKAVMNPINRPVGELAHEIKLLSLTQKGIIPRDLESGKGKFPSDFSTYQKVFPLELIFCLFDIDETPRAVGLSSLEGMVTGAYSVFEVKEENSPKFLSYLFHWLDNEKALKPYYTGLRKVVRPQTFGAIKIPIPPISEQNAISTFLDHETAKIDALISEQQRLIELLQEKRQAVISHAVTKGLNPNTPMKDSGVEWLGEVPEHWIVGKLCYYARLDTGSTPDRQRPEYWNGAIPWVKTGEVRYKDIFETEEKITEIALQETSCDLLAPGTLLMALYGQGVTRGRVGMLMSAASCNQACAAIISSTNIHDRYLELYLTNAYSHLRSLGNETTQQNLNLEFVGNLELLIPPLVEQESIFKNTRQKIQELEDLLLQSADAIALLKERRSALISAAVTGQIDVRGLVPEEEAA